MEIALTDADAIAGILPHFTVSSSGAVPTFQCQGHTNSTSQAALDEAPESVLAEAWRTSTTGAGVNLDAWPAPNMEVLKVNRPSSACCYGHLKRAITADSHPAGGPQHTGTKAVRQVDGFQSF